jgi:signal transduction histidine kinase/CheY-like chemotaxis protein
VWFEVLVFLVSGMSGTEITELKNVPSETEHKKVQKELSLSLILAGSLFGLFALVVIAMLAVTYNSSQIVVERERSQLGVQSGTISDLILEKRLDTLRQFSDQMADELSLISTDGLDVLYRKLEGSFYTQKEGVVDYTAIITEQGDIVDEIHFQKYEFPQIRKTIIETIDNSSRWNWAVQVDEGSQPVSLLLFYRKELLNRFTGKVDGHIIGGVFLSDNADLLKDILNRTKAANVLLKWKDNAIGSVAQNNNAQTFNKHVDPKSMEIENRSVFQTKLLQDLFPDMGLSVQLQFLNVGGKTLEDLYLISAVIAFILILVFSSVAWFAGRAIFISPLNKLIEYARKVENREQDTDIPTFVVSEFNKVSRNLKSVFSAFLESERRFLDFANITSESLWETDVQHRYTFLTRDNRQKNTTSVRAVIGKRRWDVEGVDLEDSDWSGHKEIIQKRESFRNFVFKRLDKEGNVNYWSASGKPRFDRKGKFLGYRGRSTNITREQEAQLEAEKIQSQLRQSQKLEVVGQLTGGVAHDFNNLLAVVMGNLELVIERPDLDESARKMLDDALRGAEKGAKLTHQLLAYSRQQKLRPDVLSPGTIIEGMESLLKRAIGESIHFKTSLEDEWSVLIDQNELENALMNLAVNSRDAMPYGGEISIESFNIEIDPDYNAFDVELEPGDYVCISITDTGFGIPKEIQDKIVVPFFTTKEVGKGSGLGLSMVFGFAKQSGGHLFIQSEINVGTCIKLFLPRSKAEVLDVTGIETSVVKYGVGETVLLVEDDENVSKLVVAQLRSIGYETVVCHDGPSALLYMEQNNVDFLVSDMILPGGMSGWDILKYAKQYHPHMPRLLMSGFTGNDKEQEAHDLKDVDILFKPFTKAKLSEAIFKMREIMEKDGV